MHVLLEICNVYDMYLNVYDYMYLLNETTDVNLIWIKNTNLFLINIFYAY